MLGVVVLLSISAFGQTNIHFKIYAVEQKTNSFEIVQQFTVVTEWTNNTNVANVKLTTNHFENRYKPVQIKGTNILIWTPNSHP